MAFLLLLLGGVAIGYTIDENKGGTLTQIEWVQIGVGVLLLIGAIVVFLVKGDE